MQPKLLNRSEKAKSLQTIRQQFDFLLRRGSANFLIIDPFRIESFFN